MVIRRPKQYNTHMNWKILIIYLAVQSITPGPHNLTCLYLGARGGFRAAKKFFTGSILSLLVKALLCGSLNIVLARLLPSIVNVLKWIGAAYMFYLAWNMASSGWKAEDEISGLQTESTYRSGIILQLLNAKSWVASLSVFAVYVIPFTSDFSVIALVSAVFAFLCVLASLVWIYFGAALRPIIEKHKKPFGIICGLSLVYCAVTAVL